MKQIRYGLVGCGFISNVHAEALATVPGAVVAACCSPDEDMRRAFCEKHRIPGFADHRAMLKDGNIDAVIIGVPNFLHAQIALDAAAAGKHVVCEKPLALTLEEAERMIEACRKAGVLLCYAEELCFVPKYERARELSNAGAIGRVYRVHQVEKHAGPYSEWFFDPARAGGGILMDMGCHSIEFARAFLGKPPVRAVTAWMDTVLHRERTRMEDDVVLLLEFEGGASALLESSWALLGGMDSITHILGTEGVIHADLLKGQGLSVFSLQGYGDYAPGARGWTFPDVAWSFTNGYPQEDAHFTECMRTGAAPRESGEDGRMVLEIMLAAYASAAERRTVALPYRPPADIRVPVDLWLRRKGA